MVCDVPASAQKAVRGKTGVPAAGAQDGTGANWGRKEESSGAVGSVQYHAGGKISSSLEKTGIAGPLGVLCWRLTGVIDHFHDL